MSPIDGYGWAADFPTWRGEVAARFQDFLARKKGLAADKWMGFLRRVEESVSTAQLKATVRQVLERLRRDRVGDSGDAAVDAEFEILCARILESGREDTIENYGAFLFTVDLKL